MEIGMMLGEDIGQIRERLDQTNRALRDKLWHASHGAFDVFDLRSGEHMNTRIAAGFLPLLCGAPTLEQARRIYEVLESVGFCTMHDGSCFSIPNYDLTGESLDLKNYWRGPVWIKTNWLLMQGLKRYACHEKATSVRHDIIELVHNWGFHEYFEPYKGAGYGSDNFSWTAALFIDAVVEELESLFS
jgi:neutral trehalase